MFLCSFTSIIKGLAYLLGVKILENIFNLIRHNLKVRREFKLLYIYGLFI